VTRELTFPGGWHCAARPNRTFVVLIPGSHLETHAGRVEFPSPGEQPLYVVLSRDGSRFAAQSQKDDRAIEYSFVTKTWRRDTRVAVGTCPVIYDANDELQVSNGVGNANGYRYVAPGGRLVTGDETLNPSRGNGHDLYEFTVLPSGLVIGQRGAMNDEWQVWDGKDHRRILVNDKPVQRIRFPKETEDAGTVALATYCLTPDGQDEERAVLAWRTEDELRTMPLATVTPIAPPGPPLVAGAWRTTAETPGNLSLGPDPSKAAICTIEELDQVEPSRLLGLFVDWSRDYTLTQRIAQCQPKAEALQVPLVIYVDDREYRNRLPEIVAAVGETSWIALLQMYLECRGREGESIDDFASECAGQAAGVPVPWIAAVRCTTPAGSGITVDRVVAALNALAPIVADPQCLGWALWAWNRADGVTGVPALRPAADAWLKVETELEPSQARQWAADYCAGAKPEEPLTVTITDYTKIGTAPLTVIVQCETNARDGAKIEALVNGSREALAMANRGRAVLQFPILEPGEYSLKARVIDGDRKAETGALRLIRVTAAPPPEIPGITYPTQPGSGSPEDARKPWQDAADAAKREG
jgi:hypothetical protein